MAVRKRSSPLLINESPLQVLPTLALILGLAEAIFLQQVQYWLNTSRHVYDERYWVYNTLPQWQEQLPFWVERTIQRIIANLRKEGVLLVTSEYNATRADRTSWYSIDYDRLDQLLQDHHDKVSSPSRQNVVTMTTNDRDHDDKMAHSIIMNQETTTKDNNKRTEEGEGAPAAHTVASPPPAPAPTPQKEARSKPKAQKEAREEHPAVTLYRSLCAKQLNDAQVKLLEQTNPPLDILERAIKKWKEAGNRPTNVAGVLDWVKFPERMSAYQSGNSKVVSKNSIYARPDEIIRIDPEVQAENDRWAREAYPERFADEKEEK